MEHHGAVNKGVVNKEAVNKGAVNKGAVNKGAVNKGAVEHHGLGLSLFGGRAYRQGIVPKAPCTRITIKLGVRNAATIARAAPSH